MLFESSGPRSSMESSEFFLLGSLRDVSGPCRCNVALPPLGRISLLERSAGLALPLPLDSNPPDDGQCHSEPTKPQLCRFPPSQAAGGQQPSGSRPLGARYRVSGRARLLRSEEH